MPEETDKPEKLRPRFYLLAALLLAFFAGLWWLLFKVAFHLVPTEIHWNDIYLSWVEKRGPRFVVYHAIVFFILPIAAVLFLVYRRTHAFQKSRERSLYWLYLTIAALTGLLVSLLCWYLIFRHSFAGHFAAHPFYYNVLARSILCTGLLLVGFFLYLFKKYLKIFYGLSQIVIAILSSLTLLEESDLNHMPALDLSKVGLFAFVAFTFLLSKGVSDVVEGVKEWIDKTPASPQPTEPVSASPAAVE
ncbi:hypothetical protein [Tunturibacter empetritectus]|uniref:Magnesium-transporting ATPase (P-type) n=1 Tax=Tunturiibacter lichenicola TaxID=2051959 RepID=A0A7W8N676_9BACT|nr:hypothetical protein [Edaphobacter lichenicola]MBB5345301.1 magnesium-transporting ATPase (P-type) [Edaphobacter lichenicola]